MEKRAQESLEYLMTYGWALVLIVSIMSVLFVVVSGIGASGGKLTCVSTAPTKIIVESYDFPWSGNYYAVNNWCPNNSPLGYCGIWGNTTKNDAPGKMVLKNATGGQIAIKKIARDYDASTSNGCTSIRYFGPFKIKGTSVIYNPVDIAIFSNPITIENGGKIDLSDTTLYIIETTTGGSNCSQRKFILPPIHTFQLTYTDYAGNTKDVNVTCAGYPETPVSIPL